MQELLFNVQPRNCFSPYTVRIQQQIEKKNHLIANIKKASFRLNYDSNTKNLTAICICIIDYIDNIK